MFDAYTVKKVMPRLVIAAILIQLSWPLVTGLIYIVAQISWGLEGLLYLPFNGRDALDINETMKAANPEAQGTLQLLFGGVIVLGAAGPSGLLALATLVMFALLTAFVVLLFRQIIIILLVVASPLAILAWVLPGTERFWKFWWSTLTKTLMMYPLILLLFAGGRISAKLMSTATEDMGMPAGAKLIAILVVFFAPFFLVGKTFSMAGGALAMVGGALAARTGKMQAGMNKFALGRRKQALANKKENFKAGNYQGRAIPKKYRGAVMDKVNNASRRASLGAKGRFGFGAAGRTAMDTKVATGVAGVMQNEDFKANANNEPVLRALASGSTEGEAIKNLQANFGYSQEEARSLAASARTIGPGFGLASRQAAAMQLATSSTGYDDIHQMEATLGGAAAGSSSAASRLAGFANAAAKRADRHDLAPGYGALVSAVHQAGNITNTSGAGSRPAEGPMSPEEASRTVTGARGIDSTSILRGRSESVGHITDALRTHAYNQADIVNAAPDTHSDEEVARAQNELNLVSSQIRDLERSAQMGYGSTDNNETVLDMAAELDSILTVPPRGGTPGGAGDLNNPHNQPPATPPDPDNP